MDPELIRRIGYIAGRLVEIFPGCEVRTRPLCGGTATGFTVTDNPASQVVLDRTMTNAEILTIAAFEPVVDTWLEVAQRVRDPL